MAVPISISANCTRLSYAIEQEGVDPENLPWQALDPESYTGDFGSTPQWTTATTVGSGRAPQKGRISGKDVSVAFQNYQRQKELQPFLPGFFINFPIETPATNKIRPPATNAPTVTAVTASRSYTGTNFTEANGWKTGDGNYLVVAENFSNRANNGLKEITAISQTSLTTRGTTVAETTSTGSLETCGYVANKTGELPALTFANGILTLKSTLLGTGGSLELQRGMFVYLGGDATATKFAQAANQGFARVSQVSAGEVQFDLTTFTPVADAGKATTQIFIPTRVFKDDIECDASRRSLYSFERRLGKSDTANPHEQSQLVTGAFPNQLTLSMESKADVKASLTFMARESYRRSGKDTANAPWSGTNIRPIDKGEIYTTGDDIKHNRIYRHDRTSPNPNSFIGTVQTGSFTLNNNTEGIPGWGTFANVDVNPGNLMVDVEVTGLFTDIEILDLAEEGLDVGFYVIFARGNAGYILDIPKLTLQTSALTVESGQAITINVTQQGNESDFGYAGSFQYFDYLPNVATAKRRI